MNFSLSEEQSAIQNTAREFSRRELLPHYQQREQDGALEPELRKTMGALGFYGMLVPEELGGTDLGALTCGLLMEEIAYGDHGVSYMVLINTLLGYMLWKNAQESIVQEWVPKICAGERVVALGLTEPGGGSDAAHLQMRATADGDSFVLNGEKTSISLANIADGILVFARTDQQVAGARGVSAFLVPMDSSGISRTEFSDMGVKCIGRGSVFFEEVRVPAANLVGSLNQGFIQVMQGFDISRVLIGLQCIGTAAASLDETWAYVTDRHAFGAPIVSFEGVSFPLAESETLLEAARGLCHKTLWMRDAGRPHTTEAAMCKWWAPKISFEVIKECLLLHGHGGYSNDFPHQQRLRDVLGLQIGDGTAQIMKLIIAREKVGRAAIPY